MARKPKSPAEMAATYRQEAHRSAVRAGIARTVGATGTAKQHRREAAGDRVQARYVETGRCPNGHQGCAGTGAGGCS